MQLCYVDEAGSTGALASANASEQPVFLIVGVLVDQRVLIDLTADFMSVKRRFFPGLVGAGSHYLDGMRVEIKGATQRGQLRTWPPVSHKKHRHTIGYLDHCLQILERHGAQIVARVWVKGIGAPQSGRALYTSSVQALSVSFQHRLVANNDLGLIVLDSRDKGRNAIVSHSVFTQKFRLSGDPYNRIVEAPLFAHSQNHAGLQLADLLSSAFLFPMATWAYCTGHVSNVHVQPGFQILASTFGTRLQKLSYRYRDHVGRWRGGVTVSDPIAHRSTAVLFGSSSSAPSSTGP